jgi:hypothetical protein
VRWEARNAQREKMWDGNRNKKAAPAGFLSSFRRKAGIHGGEADLPGRLDDFGEPFQPVEAEYVVG